ncbi:MAG: DUF4352 domain-containing protein [Bryobacteraceae bacterium]|jgi:hypothetical protein
MYTLQSYLAGAALTCLAASTACTPSVSPEASLRRLGERVTIGSLIYNVFEDQWKAQLGQGTDTRVPKDRFFLVRFSVVNGGSADVMVPTMTLLDDAGQTYAELSDGDQVPQWVGYLRRVRPAETIQGNVVFDVPPKHYRLRITDESSQFARDIDLPLTFASDTPDLPTQQ